MNRPSLIAIAALIAIMAVPVAISRANPAGPYFMSLPVVYQAPSNDGGVPTSIPTAGPTATSTPGTGPTPTNTPVAGKEWLNRLNALRAMANLPAVTENTAWSDGGVKHSIYMVKNNFIGHEETSGNPFYTVEGEQAARNGNVAKGGAGLSDAAFVNLWAVGPFHMIGMIDPRLTQSGFGSHREGSSGAATLDVLRGIGPAAPGSTFPVLWPANGKALDVLAYTGNESPDPLTACADYTPNTGTPLYVMTQNPAIISASTITLNGAPLEHCRYDGTTYTNPNPGEQDLARSILSGRNAHVIIPRQPLQPGSAYTVSITLSGNPMSWTFTTSGVANVQSTMTDTAIR